jgi:hypothetical protein
MNTITKGRCGRLYQVQSPNIILTDPWLALRVLNHLLKRVSTDHKEITLSSQWEGQAQTARERTTPTSGEIS